MLAVLFLLAAVALQGILTSPGQKHVKLAIKESHPVPRAYTRISAAPADKIISLEIGLKQAKFTELERQLYDISDPDSANYGRHLTIDQINDFVAPSDGSLRLVEGWLESRGISKEQLTHSPANDWIHVSLPISKVETLLDTKYSIYQHEDGTKLMRTPQYSLPEDLHDHIDLISPTNTFLNTKKARTTFASNHLKSNDKIARDLPLKTTATLSASSGAANISGVCNATHVTPTCLRTLYQTIDYTPQVPGKNKVALTDYLSESNNRSDTRLFLQKYRPDAISAADSFKFEVIANGSTSQAPTTQYDVEGNLDVQTLIGIDYPTPLTAFTTGGVAAQWTPDSEDPTDGNEPYLKWLHHVLKQRDLPQTISNSYADNEQTVPFSFAKRVCNGFAQLGARGITVLFGSGDSGVGGVHESTPDQCVTNDGRNATSFLACFPASCPYVLTVGATKNFDPEVVAYQASDNYASGGGFSNYFKTPSYQKSVVDAYVSGLGTQYAGLYNTTGRGYPDVSAQGFDYAIFWGGIERSVGGTSAATPTFTGVISLLNDARIAAGKPTMGFINPWLYKVGYQALTDVTSGSAVGCGLAGFPATKGWDAVTGFGTPLFEQLKTLALANSTSQ